MRISVNSRGYSKKACARQPPKRPLTDMVLILALVVAQLPSLSNASGYNSYTTGKLVFFGTSVSDTGNVFKLTNQTIPPPQFGYFKGRFTNGRVWVEHVAKGAKLASINFAFGGAGACPEGNDLDANGNPAQVPPIGQQIQTYLSKADRSSIKTNTYIVEGGPNDYFTYAARVALGQVNPIKSPFNPATVVGCLEAGIRKLLKEGATKIAVGNLLDLTFTPLINPNLPKNRPEPAALLKQLIPVHNKALKAAVEAMRADFPGAQIEFVDFYGIGHTIIANPKRFGLLNAIDTTLNQFVKLENGLEVPTLFRPIPHLLAWFDRVHPSARAHEIIGKKAYKHLAKKGFFAS